MALAWVVPESRARAKAAAVLARAVGIPFPRPFAARVRVRHVRLGPALTGDLYWPGGPAPPIVLAPGGTPLGAKDPRVERVARSIAGAHRVVFVVDLGLVRQTFVWADERRLVDAARDLRKALDRPPGLLGFSYGGSFCLLAAEDPGIGQLSFVATFGAYDDLADVAEGLTTGATIQGGRVVPWRASPEARPILNRASVQLTPASFRSALEAALRTGNSGGLDPASRAVFDFLMNHDPRRAQELAAALPPAFRSALARFSPARGIRRLHAPLFVMQSVNDPATPPFEAERLHASVAGSGLIVLHWYLHVTPPGGGTPVRGYVDDGWGAWTFTSWLLAAQEP